MPLIILFGIGVLWKGVDLARAPRDRVLRLLVVCLLLLLGGEVLSIPGINSAIDEATITGAGKVAFNAIYMSGLCALNLFFASSVGGSDGAYRRHLRSSTGLLCGVLIALVATMTATPAAMRGHSLATPYMGEPPIALFYLVGNVYFLYAYLAAARWALRYARKAAQHLGVGLRVMALGLLGLAATSVNRMILVALRYDEPGSHEVFNAVNWSLSDWAMGVTLVGICYSASVQVLTRVRSMARHRRMYHELTPLWTALTTAYPELVLKEPPAGARWRRLRPHRTHEQRFCRRVIECRDGLVCLSPYLARVASGTDLAHAPAQELARHITEALALNPTTESPQTELPAVRVAAPASGDLEADARELIAVSRALDERKS
ncbi:MAB_1171c family putative transporter [Streptomyces sp. NPDC006314]|uniref:MAB_1171c family putative transporter n=1 Tax=Streptomyces sp. NPDC006314 TaxID=3154475 RepID=UPI0033A5C5F3